MSKFTIGAFLAVALVFIVAVFMKNDGSDLSSREVALTCTTDMATQFHIHPVLEIYILGEKQLIPSNIGIKPTCMTALHTHTSDGVIHVESPYKKDFTLGDFFAVWQMPFSREEIFEHKADERHAVRVTVNGMVVDTYENTVFYDEDVIAIYYESIEPVSGMP